MTTAKPILYGVSDFVLMRTKGAYYIDRTAYIRELEDSRYVMFLRPRRFGKSLLLPKLSQTNLKTGDAALHHGCHAGRARLSLDSAVGRGCF